MYRVNGESKGMGLGEAATSPSQNQDARYATPKALTATYNECASKSSAGSRIAQITRDATSRDPLAQEIRHAYLPFAPPCARTHVHPCTFRPH